MAAKPGQIVEAGRVEPVPRRIRALLEGRVALDTTAALYVWDVPYYPRFRIPAADVEPGVLERLVAAGAARVEAEGAGELAGTVSFDWDAFDSWLEEDEEVFGHPRSPYVRVDALRSSREVRIEIDGVVMAESSAPVLVFETGLRSRYYLDRTAVRFEHLTPSDTVTACPYKGTTSGYWNARVNGVERPDIAWAYDFPRRELLPIAGLVAFYDEKVDVFVDGERQD